MSASVAEQILARVALVLTSAALATTVERARTDAFADSEVPALNIKRGNVSEDAVGNNGARLVIAWIVEHHVSGVAGWETAADALHMAAHTALCSDATLASLGRGLRCTGSDVDGDSADRVVGRLVAHYQMQVFVRPGDLTRSIL
jgi:hypothetical protein